MEKSFDAFTLKINLVRHKRIIPGTEAKHLCGTFYVR